MLKRFVEENQTRKNCWKSWKLYEDVKNVKIQVLKAREK